MSKAEAEALALIKYPILRTDCRLERLRKEFLRLEYIKRFDTIQKIPVNNKDIRG